MEMQALLKDIAQCRLCAAELPCGPRPVVRASAGSSIVIIGQAPGRLVHESGIPWDDPSGKRLRAWLEVDNDSFYNPDHFGIVPMGFCFPGTGKSGDLGPRPECAPQWHEPLFQQMKQVQLTLLVGRYAQAYYLGKQVPKTLTQTVANFRSYLPEFLPLPHPSPRNRRWFSKNPWFDQEVLPLLRLRVRSILGDQPLSC